MVNDLLHILPLLVLSGGSLLVLMLDVFFKDGWPRALFTGTVLLGALVATASQSELSTAGLTVFGGLVFVDPFTVFITALLVIGAGITVMLSVGGLKGEGVEAPGEYYSLLLMSTAGAVIFIASAELITLFLGLEIMSMALYALCGSAVSRRRSSESALKYFLLGSFSSAFMLYGIAVLYGLTGSTIISEIAPKIPEIDGLALHFALGLILIGVVFKIGAVPFHFWAPDVYEGAPTAVTAYMACVIKASAVAVALRIFWNLFEHLVVWWGGLVWVIAVLTMCLGNLVALRQRSMKRMLAYSSIAHAGYLAVALLAHEEKFGGGPAILYYLVAYTAMTMGAFGVVLAVTSRYNERQAPDDIIRFNGLGYTSPILGVAMAVFMLGLAGIPPGLAGLVGKFYLFNAAVKANYLGLAIIGVLNSAISCYYYLRVIVSMYFIEPEDETVKYRLALPVYGALIFCMVGVVGLGLFPAWLYDSAVRVMKTF